MVTSNSVIAEVSNGLKSVLTQSMEVILENGKKDMSAMGYAEAHDCISNIFNNMKTLAKNTIFEEYMYPKFNITLKTFESDGKLSYVQLKVHTPLKAEVKYTVQYDINNTADIFREMADAIIEGADVMLKLDYAKTNLEAINERMAEATKDCDVKIKFVLNDEDYIVDVTDDTIVYGAWMEYVNEASALDLMAVADEDDMFMQGLAQRALEKITESVKGLTVAQVIKHCPEIVGQLTGQSFRRRADKLLRSTYHKQAVNIVDSKKPAVGYVYKTVNVDGEDVEIFSLLEKTAEGEMKVKVSPFNIKTGYVVDYDILNNYKD